MAFPVTSVLDAFSGGAAVLSSPWTGRIRGTGTESGQLQTTGAGQCQVNSNGTLYSSSAYRSDQTYGPDCEVYFTVATKPGAGNPVELWARITNPASATVSGYRIDITDVSGAGNDTWQLVRVDNNVNTNVGAAITQEVTAGDGVGMSIVGSTITFWYKAGAGAWTSLGTRTDTTYSAAGNIGVGLWFSTVRIDDFGGGTIPATSQPSAFQ